MYGWFPVTAPEKKWHTGNCPAKYGSMLVLIVQCLIAGTDAGTVQIGKW
jgi:hypothetical protein